MVLAPIELNLQKAIYDSYKDDAENSWKQKALEEGVKKIPIVVPAAGLAKVGVTTVGKVVPGITAAFAVSDGIDGWNTAKDTFSEPGLAEKLAHSQASVVNGLTLGLVPKQPLAKKIANGYHKLANDTAAITAPEAPTDQEVTSRIKLMEILNKNN